MNVELEKKEIVALLRAIETKQERLRQSMGNSLRHQLPKRMQRLVTANACGIDEPKHKESVEVERRRNAERERYLDEYEHLHGKLKNILKSENNDNKEN